MLFKDYQSVHSVAHLSLSAILRLPQHKDVTLDTEQLFDCGILRHLRFLHLDILHHKQSYIYMYKCMCQQRTRQCSKQCCKQWHG